MCACLHACVYMCMCVYVLHVCERVHVCVWGGVGVAHLVEVLVVKCCTKWFLMTDHLSSWTVLFIITTWLQCAELGVWRE